MDKFTFALLTLIMAVLAVLIYAAGRGSLIATAALAVVATVVLIVTGALIALYATRQAALKEQQNFVANAKENIQIMTAMQSLQNKQNHAVMQQISQQGRLPSPDGMMAFDPANSLIIDDALFDELED